MAHGVERRRNLGSKRTELKHKTEQPENRDGSVLGALFGPDLSSEIVELVECFSLVYKTTKTCFEVLELCVNKDQESG